MKRSCLPCVPIAPDPARGPGYEVPGRRDPALSQSRVHPTRSSSDGRRDASVKYISRNIRSKRLDSRSSPRHESQSSGPHDRKTLSFRRRAGAGAVPVGARRRVPGSAGTGGSNRGAVGPRPCGGAAGSRRRPVARPACASERPSRAAVRRVPPAGDAAEYAVRVKHAFRAAHSTWRGGTQAYKAWR